MGVQLQAASGGTLEKYVKISFVMLRRQYSIHTGGRGFLVCLPPKYTPCGNSTVVILCMHKLEGPLQSESLQSNITKESLIMLEDGSLI